MTRKERRDIETMEHFAPEPFRISEEDRQAMADWSSRGESPRDTVGVEMLRRGKTLREAQMDMWLWDMKDGLLFADEILEDEALPESVHSRFRKAISV